MKNFGFGEFVACYVFLALVVLLLVLFGKNIEASANRLFRKFFPKKRGGIGIPEIKRKPPMPKIDWIEEEDWSACGSRMAPAFFISYNSFKSWFLF